ncbi:MAG TPA: hypothetical protein VII98_07160 [Solirubrobacteraceae bacterium]
MSTRAAILAVLAALGVPLAGAPGADAFWKGSGAGAGGSAVGTLSAPAATVPATATGTVTVTFTASTVTPSSPALNAEVTYLVQRSSDGGVTWVATSGTCGAGLAAPATTCTDAPPTSGSYRYRVTGRFRTWTAAGATSTAVTVTVPVLTAPTITARPAARSANTAPSFSFTGGGGTGYECRLDGSAWAACTSPKALSGLASGSHTFDVHATSSGVAGPAASVTWTVDTAAPAITTGVPDPSASTTAAFTLTQAGYTTIQCRLDGGAWATCASPKTFTALADGSHTIDTRALDADGVATATASRTWRVATAAPTITAQPPASSSQTTANFTFTDTGFTSFRCRLDGGAFGPCDTGSAAYTGLAVGSHTFTVHALDAAGVATADRTVTWTVTAAPNITFLGGCTLGSGGGQDRIIGTTTISTGTVTVQFFAGATATGTPVATLTTGTFIIGPLWTVQSAVGQLTSGATYTAKGQQTDGTGGLSNIVTCTFTAS